MPEGDSIRNLARRLAPVLVGREVTAFVARRIPEVHATTVVGHRIDVVEAIGKNLLIRFDDGRTLHIHLKMHGRVHLRQAKPQGLALAWSREASPRRVVGFGAKPHPVDLDLVVQGGATIVGRDLPICRLLSRAEARRVVGSVGPDLASPDWDEHEVLRRIRLLARSPRTLGARRVDWEIGEALLVQKVAAGIGNVYKSEVLFLSGVHPRALVRSLDDETILAVYRRASELLRSNVGRRGPRTTRPTLGRHTLWVYERASRVCLRCAARSSPPEPITTIHRFMQGPESGRSTYYCPTCQPHHPP